MPLVIDIRARRAEGLEESAGGIKAAGTFCVESEGDSKRVLGITGGVSHDAIAFVPNVLSIPCWKSRWRIGAVLPLVNIAAGLVIVAETFVCAPALHIDLGKVSSYLGCTGGMCLVKRFVRDRKVQGNTGEGGNDTCCICAAKAERWGFGAVNQAREHERHCEVLTIASSTIHVILYANASGWVCFKEVRVIRATILRTAISECAGCRACRGACNVRPSVDRQLPSIFERTGHIEAYIRISQPFGLRLPNIIKQLQRNDFVVASRVGAIAVWAIAGVAVFHRCQDVQYLSLSEESCAKQGVVRHVDSAPWTLQIIRHHRTIS
mmetsp:Transcript_13601/g.27360  ORF Transcript_13601/g.27360 Transcript_13601/m.27360 type:complete len:322 (+) Transcript_13601:1212-2177(+)